MIGAPAVLHAVLQTALAHRREGAGGMKQRRLDLAFLGLSLSSSWGNGHATTYRALLRGLAERGQRFAVPGAGRSLVRR